jgi:hypothetical protein
MPFIEIPSAREAGAREGAARRLRTYSAAPLSALTVPWENMNRRVQPYPLEQNAFVEYNAAD